MADPNDADAKYVHFFHEKIPSRFVGNICKFRFTLKVHT